MSLKVPIAILFILAITSNLASTSGFKTKLKRHNKINPKDSALNTLGVPLYNLDDVQYSASISLGSNDQTFQVIMDTGSGVLWVPTPQVNLFPQTFNCSQSTTCVNTNVPFGIQYGEGDISGVIAYDTLNVGGLSLGDFKFTMVNSASDFGSNPTFSGILGLGPSGDAQFPQLFVTLLKNAGLIQNASFGVYLAEESGSDGGEIYFGGYDLQYMGDPFQTLSVNNTYPYWGVTIESVSYGETLVMNQCYGVIDTGTSLTAFPQSVINMVVTLSGTTCNTLQNGLYVCACRGTGSFDDLTLTYQNVTLTIPASSLWVSDGNSCILMMQPSPMPGIIILGDVFIQNYYVYYDYDTQQISFSLLYYASNSYWWVYFLLVAVVVGLIAYFWRRRQRKNLYTLQGNFNQTSNTRFIQNQNTQSNQSYQPSRYHYNPNNSYQQNLQQQQYSPPSNIL